MLDGIPVASLTPSVLLGITVLLLLFGKIVPRSTLVDKEKESERWQNAYMAEREARATAVAQTTELLEVSKATQSIVVATFGYPNSARQTGGADVVSPK